MEAIRDYMRSIALYLILDSFIGIILPHGKYKKYISLVSGLILILLLVNPINKVIDFMTVFRFPQANKFDKREITEVWQDAVVKQISDIAHKIGIELSDIRLDKKEIDGIEQLQAIKIKFAHEIDITSQQNFKQMLKSLYGVEDIDFDWRN